ncbi:hypothetical protein SK128_002163 [Halocaridina rubra]|uniref:Neurotransmitter-gated ion-channel transmembrane domain-containing protein n=1 Tax=Halocaridina rubra TaxID=373956 RepID=A0AAN8X3C2_HALRR
MYIFQDRIMVSLTSLLVLSSLFNQSSSSLPKTSYFKLVDVWFLTSIVTIFVIIVIQTILDHLRHHSKENFQDETTPRNTANTSNLPLSRQNKLFISSTIPTNAWSSSSFSNLPMEVKKAQNIMALHSEFTRWCSSRDIIFEESRNIFRNGKAETEQRAIGNQKMPTGIQLGSQKNKDAMTLRNNYMVPKKSNRLSRKICSRLSKTGLLTLFLIFLITYWAMALYTYYM